MKVFKVVKDQPHQTPAQELESGARTRAPVDLAPPAGQGVGDVEWRGSDPEDVAGNFTFFICLATSLLPWRLQVVG